MSRILNIILVLLVLLAIALRQGKWLDGNNNSTNVTLTTDAASVSMDYVKQAYPNAAGVREIDTSWVEVYDGSRQKIGEVMLSSPYSDKIMGYAGRTPLLIAMDTSRVILQVQFLNNVESPSYLEMVIDAGVLNAWDGLSLPAALEKKVDNVTGATYTTKAIVRSLQTRLAVATDSDRKVALFSWYDILKHFTVLLILALALYSFFRPAKAKKFRIVLLLLSVVVLGFWQSSMLSLVQFFTWLTNGIPLATQWVMLLILLFAIGLPMFTGKVFYCNYLCPFGAAQELVGKLNKRKIKLGQKLIGWLLLLRKAMLIFVVLLLVLGLEFDLTAIEPFSAFNISAAPLMAIIVAGVSLVLSIFITKPWCRFFCPTGQTLDAFKKEPVKKKSK
jgi:Na+-translocating ferredoxin:NAD+ oxidoreductase RnfG subunit